METITKIYTVLNDKELIGSSAFFFGLITGIPFRKSSLRKPLTSLGKGVLTALLCCFGAECVGHILPENLKFLIPTSCLISCTYIKINDTLYPEPDKPFLTITYNNFTFKLE
jgi:hypothetical protein